MFLGDPNPNRTARWYFGGLSSTFAACITHPIDMLKVFLQTQQQKEMNMRQMIVTVYKSKGIKGFYNGLSASLTRQITYTTARFGLYEEGKRFIDTTKFSQKVGLAITVGMMASLIGIPTDMVNVRMQNDMKLPKEKRRNYKHVFDGLYRVTREEGFTKLFTGGSFGVARGVMITIGQNAVYDQVKNNLMNSFFTKDDIPLHFTSSLISSFITTTLAQPLDTLKTRHMNAKPGQYKSLWDVIYHTARAGPLGFFKGYFPSFVRVGPHTIILYLVMEQMRLRYGILPNDKDKNRDKASIKD